ncbi:(2Fe-2S)-binding protein [Octadecabacter sp. G9-8]|uniref:(2Fe-2S)-binding protein n=1 Tax=Octadecabacter dasysiphoniae TaxID=2909341 RepID=A0ABS9D0T4_9RHOB|nr:(2Fe-2S)-binding protein [Octadecabacter dasysiphoniae]MCF2871996.1 (2Fe-2S)-binding protein [Octadecabacter dasysiphoniae]
MFKLMEGEDVQDSVTFLFENQPVSATPGMSVAAALLAADVSIFRQTPVSQSARGPFCMMGACYDCLVFVDGMNVQACMTKVRDGMKVSRVPIINKDIET